MLTLKQKLQLFKLAKKPRKQIRLRLQVIANSLNLPSLQKTSKQLKLNGSQKQQKLLASMSNFKKIDKTRHNIASLSSHKISDPVQITSVKRQDKQNSNRVSFDECYEEEINCSKVKESCTGHKQRSVHRDSDKKKRRKIYHSNSNADFLLEDWSFNMSREQKEKKWKEQRIKQSRLDYTYLLKQNSHSDIKQSMPNLISPKLFGLAYSPPSQPIDLIKLKNQYNSLLNMNQMYKAQLQNTKKLQKIAWNANRLSQLMIKSDGLKDIKPGQV